MSLLWWRWIESAERFPAVSVIRKQFFLHPSRKYLLTRLNSFKITIAMAAAAILRRRRKILLR